jgi:hypothetical protein
MKKTKPTLEDTLRKFDKQFETKYADFDILGKPIFGEKDIAKDIKQFLSQEITKALEGVVVDLSNWHKPEDCSDDYSEGYAAGLYQYDEKIKSNIKEYLGGEDGQNKRED